MSTPDQALSSERTMLALLVGQGFFLGAALSFLYVAGNTLFLVDFGSEALAYVYIAVGILVSLVFFGLATLRRRWSLARFAVAIYLGVSAVFFLARLALTLPGSRWVSFGLMVFFTLFVQVAMVVIGAQAGRLLDVRQMKRLFPRVFAGIAIGVVLAGLAVPILVDLVGGAENLLVLAGTSILVAMALLLVLLRRFADRLGETADNTVVKKAKSLGQLLRSRFTLNLFSYQMLSAIGSQLVIYIFLTQADARFPNAEALASFFGSFMGIRNVINLLFLLTLAGILISRHGLGFGLMINPLAVGGAMVVMLAFGVIWQPAGVSFFWLATIIYVMDIVLTDGITSTSIKTTYQALPSADRSTVETAVEGIGVPVAFGLTGLILVGFNAVPGLSLLHVIGFTALVAVIWLLAAAQAFRSYTSALLQTVKRRALGEAELSLDDAASLAVVQRLAQSSRLREVRLALDMLEQARHPSLTASLLGLMDHVDPRMRAEALARIEKHRLKETLPAIAPRVDAEEDPFAQGAAVRALLAVSGPDAVARAIPFLEHPERGIRAAAIIGLLRYGGESGSMAARESVRRLQQADSPADRCLLARIIGEVDTPDFDQLLVPLLQDGDVTVRAAALLAASRLPHPHLLPLVIANLDQPSTRSAAMTALIASGEAMIPFVAEGLAGTSTLSSEQIIRLIRAASQVKGDRVIALLRQHIAHPHPEVRTQVLAALRSCDYQPEPGEVPILTAYLRDEAQAGLGLLQAGLDLGDEAQLAPLRQALGQELEQVRRRALLVVSFRPEGDVILRAGARLRQGNKADRALALEMLEVILSAEEKALIFPLCEPGLTPDQRIQRLGRQMSADRLGLEQRLIAIIGDSGDAGVQPWSKACAIYAAGLLRANFCAGAVEEALDRPHAMVRETALWALHLLAPERFQVLATGLSQDADPALVDLVAHLQAGGHSPA